MTNLTATVQVFDHRISRDDDAGRAEAAVNHYLAALPGEAAEWFSEYAADMNGEDHDRQAAAKFSAIYQEAHRIARDVATAEWLIKNTGATEVHVEFVAGPASFGA